jgi:predicted transcriptional regulator
MNERIKELAEQALPNIKYWNDELTKEIEAPKNRAVTVDELEKFAEIIVRECLLCCERTISDPVPESVDTFEQGGIHCMDEIKEHFGVEK